jgi:BON domain
LRGPRICQNGTKMPSSTARSQRIGAISGSGGSPIELDQCLFHREAGAARPTDTGIRDRILAEVGRQSRAAGADVDVVVRKGLADLWGTVANPAQRNALQVLAEGAPVIKSVINHLRWDDDVTPTRSAQMKAFRETAAASPPRGCA